MEFALLMPVLVTVLFGTIEFGYQFNDYQSMRQGVREAARQGAVKSFGSTCALGTFAGTTPSTDVQNLMCTTKN